jgi:regulator of replication initiation timing
MSTHKSAKRLETDIEKLNNIINSLVEENHVLKTILNQYQTPAPQRTTQTN